MFKRNSGDEFSPSLFYDSFTNICINENFEETLKIDNEKKIILYHDNNHFDLVVDLSSFFI